MIELLRALRDTVVDNPIPGRDTAVRLRSKAGIASAIGGVLVLVAAAGIVVVAAVNHDGELIRWADPRPYGRPLVAAVVITALVLLGLGLPIAGAVSLASERESGTLDLLRTTAMTPGQITMGKLLATVATGVPLLLALPPLLAIGGWMGDVSALDIAGFSLLALLHAVAAAAVGTFVGAWAQRVRTATAPALVAAAASIGVPVTVPSIVLLVAWSMGEATIEALPLVVASASILGIVTAASLVGARSALAPRALGRRRYRTVVVNVSLLLFPSLVAAALALVPSNADEEALGNLLLSSGLLVLLCTVVIDVAASGRGADERSILGTFAVAAGKATLGIGLAGGVAALALVWGRPALGIDVALPIFAAVLVLGLGLACAAALTGVVGTAVRGTATRVAITGISLILVGISPLLVAAAYWSVGLESDLLLLALNPLAQIASVAPELDLLDLPSRGRQLRLLGTNVPTVLPGLLSYAALLSAGVAVLLRRRTG